jgi:two-component system, LytTR family, response regulator LytT
MNYYLFGSRILTHIIFWAGYYLFFGFIWARNGEYFASYFLEFLLLPVRILSAYVVLYWLIPRFLKVGKYLQFATGYLILIIVAGTIQRVFTFYYYEGLLNADGSSLYSVSSLIRNIILINSTVLFLTSLKVIKLWHLERQENKHLREKDEVSIIELKADKRVYRLKPSDILYLESLGNYVTYHLINKRLTSYETLTDVADRLPSNFSRAHKSFIINKDHIISYTSDEVQIGNQKIPIGRSYRSKVLP